MTGEKGYSLVLIIWVDQRNWGPKTTDVKYLNSARDSVADLLLEKKYNRPYGGN